MAVLPSSSSSPAYELYTAGSKVIFITQAHFLNHISNRADIQLPGAFQAETFILTSLSVVVQPGDKDHGDIFFASAAQRWFHRRVHSFVGCHDLVVCYPNMGL